jgi:hypothetical protein
MKQSDKLKRWHTLMKQGGSLMKQSDEKSEGDKK